MREPTLAGLRQVLDAMKVRGGTRLALGGGMTPRALACALLLLPASAAAYRLKTDSSGTAVSFAGKEMVFALPEEVPAGLSAADVESAAKAALEAWSDAARIKLSAVSAEGEAVSGTVSFVEEDWPYDANALAVTVLKIDVRAHRILRADIKLNAQARRFRVLGADSTAGGIYDDLQSALTHELGHAIGLDHSQSQGAVMYPNSARGDVKKRLLSEDDVSGASALYGIATDDLPAPAVAMQDLTEGLAAPGCSTAPSKPMIFAALAGLLGFLAIGRRATRETARVRARPPRRR
jgi:hypothetical protein